MFRNLPEEMLVQIRCAFDLFDSNGDGSLLPNDLGNVIEQVGQKLSDLDIKEMMSFLSSTENGDEISFKDFVSLIMLMKKWDKNEDGYLDLIEFKNMMESK